MKENLLGSLEQKIMNVIWDNQSAMKPAEVQAALGNQYAYTTVMTLLSRLYQKGLLKRKLVGKAYYYQRKKSRGEFVISKLRPLFKSLLSNYGELAINQFVEAIKNDPTKVEKLEESLYDSKNVPKKRETAK